MITVYDVLAKFVFGNIINRDEFFESWAEEIILKQDTGFDTGLVGLGWITSYLLEVKKISSENYEFLNDLDDMIYKIFQKEMLKEEVDFHLMFKFITYFQQRIKHTKIDDFYRNFMFINCIKNTIRKLNESLTQKLDRTSSQSIYKNQVLLILKYSYLIDFYINESLIEDFFYTSSIQLIEDLEKTTTPIVDSNIVYMLYCALKQYDFPFLVNKLDLFISNNEGLFSNRDKNIWYLSSSFINKNKGGNIDLFEFSKMNAIVKCNYDIFLILTNLHCMHLK